jgi:hypothetical protein
MHRTQVAGLTTMLSAKGRVCNNKVFILDKMQALRDRLQGYIDQGLLKVQKRSSDADAAKSAWLDAEGEYLMLKKKAEELDALVAEDLKKVTSLTSLLELNKARLAKVCASVTEQLGEIDEEEAIIRELLGYIGDLTSSTVDVVFSRPQHLPRCFPAFVHVHACCLFGVRSHSAGRPQFRTHAHTANPLPHAVTLHLRTCAYLHALICVLVRQSARMLTHAPHATRSRTPRRWRRSSSGG